MVNVTIGDLIRKGIIKEYIPPRKGGNDGIIKKPVGIQDSSPILREVFQSWVDLDPQTKKATSVPQGTPVA